MSNAAPPRDRIGDASRLRRLADTMHRASERAAFPVGTAVLAVAAAIAMGAIAVRAPLWNDELFTYYFARLPGLGDLWRELSEGAEQTPPSFHLTARASVAVFGDSDVALRVPSLVGFALGTACTYAYVARRSAPLYGLLAALFLVGSSAGEYATEARAYPLVIGFGALALLCWQRATEGDDHRTLAVVGLGLAVAATVASHYYGILLLVPLGLGELWRSIRRRPDWPVIGALATGLVPLVVFSPLILSAWDYAATFWAEPAWRQGPDFYQSLIQPFLDQPLVKRSVLLVSAVLLAVCTGAARRRARPFAPPAHIPSHELVAVIALALLPFVGVATGVWVTDAFVSRYVIVAAVGVAVLLAFLVQRLDRWLRVLGPALVVVLAVAGASIVLDRYREAGDDADRRAATLRFLEAESDGRPVVVASAHAFFELSHDTSLHGGPILHYLADADLALEILDTDTIELGLLQLQHFAPLEIFAFDPYLASHPTFRLYGEDVDWDWVTARLRSDGYRFEPHAHRGDIVLYEVRRDDALQAP